MASDRSRSDYTETMCGSVNVKPIRVALVVAALSLIPSDGFSWGRDGHQVIANLAQSRLSPQRNNHPETARWHFVNIPLTADHYNPARDCAPSPQGDCIIAAIDRFCAPLAPALLPAAEDEP